jgi:hypothetical protein
MTFRFGKDARRDLERSLAKAGASQVTQAVKEIERLVERYRLRFTAEKVFPELKFTGEAKRLLIHANSACHALDAVSSITRRRLECERRARKEELSLPQYAEAMNDMCMFAIHAMGDGDRPIKQGCSAADRALQRLTVEVGNVWRKHTNSDLPVLPRSSASEEKAWRQMRRLQQHPIWIVYDALRIFLDAFDLNRLLARTQPKVERPTGERGSDRNASS